MISRRDKISSGFFFFPWFAQAVLGSQFSRGDALAVANGSNDEKRKKKKTKVWLEQRPYGGREGRTFSGQTSLFWLLEINTTWHECRNEMWVWTVAGDQHHPSPSKPSNPGRSERTECA